MTDIQIQSWDTFKVLEALKKMLVEAPALVAMEGRISRGEEINVNPDMAPWIGLYPLGDTYTTRTLGMGNGYRTQRVNIAVIIQNVSRTSGADCQTVLGQFQKAVIDRILSDTSIGGTMDVVEDFSVSYASPAKQAGNSTFQSSVINFTAVKQVGVSGG